MGHPFCSNHAPFWLHHQPSDGLPRVYPKPVPRTACKIFGDHGFLDMGSGNLVRQRSESATVVLGNLPVLIAFA